MIFQLSLVTFSISLCVVMVTICHTKSTDAVTDISPSKSNVRSKRFLIFQGNGVLKFVFGFSEPLDLMDKYPFRQLAASYAIHIQYPTPTRPVYWWTYFDKSTAWEHRNARTSGAQRRSKKLHSNDRTKVHKHHYNYDPHLSHYGTFVQRRYRQPAVAYDASRSAVYRALEAVFNRSVYGIRGKYCQHNSSDLLHVYALSKGLPGERCLLRTICEISQSPLYEHNALHGIINTIFSPSVSNIDKRYLRAKQIGAHGMNCAKIYWSCDEVIQWLEGMSHYF